MMEDKKNSVLIVDDERANIMALTLILSPEYTVYAAKNGTGAIEVAKEHSPDVILLDILMPDMDGYEVLAALKSYDETCDIPVIFVTGLANSDEEEKGLRVGAADYISKPFRPAIIKLRVNNQIQIQNQIKMIRQLSMTDQLTSVPNRRNFDYRMSLEWNHAKRNKIPLSIFIIDVDNFKHYNDRFGHLQGDVALQFIAKTILQSLRRSNDFTARWGGEEFVVLLPATSEAGAMEVAELIRGNIKGTVISCADSEAETVTVSVGINTLVPDNEQSMNDFIEGADKALYNAKAAGKNRVCVYESTAL
ncbi:MAG: diguanylate cyclase [Oscillospiraceae bacterium]|jgi:diguanylate cyclase (GGDEF)-like protein|nr:diguanylate cyclase [Oscillospiraceae bacterium]